MKVDQTLGKTAFFVGMIGVGAGLLLKRWKCNAAATKILAASSVVAGGGAIVFCATSLKKTVKTPINYADLSFVRITFETIPHDQQDNPNWHPQDDANLPDTSNLLRTKTVNLWFNGFEKDKEKN